jgi:hypothetical protein
MLAQGRFQASMALVTGLIRELKRLDDKQLLVEVHLCESKVHHALKNVPKARVSGPDCTPPRPLHTPPPPHHHHHAPTPPCACDAMVQVFGLTQYRKLLWLDADAYVLRNIDHLMREPMLTGAMVTACCHPIGPAYAGGGIWVVEPSQALYDDLMAFIAKPVPGTESDTW